jgi:ADP-ribose pyrophosphatase YjhB (NUDIX family)
MSVCYYCGNPVIDSSKKVCHICERWNPAPEIDEFLTEQYHRIGKNGKKYWGRLGAGILFTDGEKVLLLKRAGSDNEATWSIPGGRAEEGETPLDVARRETKEECGTIEGHRIGHFQSRDGAHHFHTYLYAVSKPFDCELSKEHSKWKWAKIKDVKEMNLHPRFKESWPTFLRAIEKHFPLKKSFSEWFESRKNK